MLVVLITHPGDRYLALPLCDQIRALGGVQNHECLIVSPLGTSLEGIEALLRSSFGKVHLHSYNETMKGWPFGANEAAQEAFLHVMQNPALLYHFLMLEPDCVPVHKHWLDIIDSEYRRCGMPILGVRVDTVEIDTKRVIAKHVVGVAVYPKNFAQVCPLVKNVRGMSAEYRRQGAMPKPWDAYFGPYTTTRIGVAETKLIQHLVREPVRGPNGMTWGCSMDSALTQASRSPGAVLIHGSKDPTFIQHLTGRTYETRKSEPQRREEEPRLQDAQKHSRQESRSESSQRSSDESPQVADDNPPRPGYAANAKVRARQIAEQKKLFAEAGIEFAMWTPECARAAFLHFDPSSKWSIIRAYASKNLGIQIYKKNKGVLINEIVRVEAEQMKESWTEVLREPESPHGAPIDPEEGWKKSADVPVEELPPPVNFSLSNATKTAVPWTPLPTGEPDTASEISPERQAQMLQMLNERRAAGIL